MAFREALGEEFDEAFTQAVLHMAEFSGRLIGSRKFTVARRSMPR